MRAIHQHNQLALWHVPLLSHRDQDCTCGGSSRLFSLSVRQTVCALQLLSRQCVTRRICSHDSASHSTHTHTITGKHASIFNNKNIMPSSKTGKIGGNHPKMECREREMKVPFILLLFLLVSLYVCSHSLPHSICDYRQPSLDRERRKSIKRC